jgi:hypothetical protein
MPKSSLVIASQSTPSTAQNIAQQNGLVYTAAPIPESTVSLVPPCTADLSEKSNNQSETFKEEEGDGGAEYKQD